MSDVAKRMRSARSVMLLEVAVLEGDGTTDSVMRLVTYYYRANGELVAKRDARPEQKDGGP